jgi:hypothetical protein
MTWEGASDSRLALHVSVASVTQPCPDFNLLFYIILFLPPLTHQAPYPVSFVEIAGGSPTWIHRHRHPPRQTTLTMVSRYFPDYTFHETPGGEDT